MIRRKERESFWGLVILWLVFSSCTVAQNTPQSLTVAGYSADELIAAYDAGAYRVIPTNGIWLEVSADGMFVYAHTDGLYRVIDGTYFGQFDNALLSPDGAYVAQPGKGIYRLSDFECMVHTNYEIVGFDHYVAGHVEQRSYAVIGAIQFSKDGKYVSVTGDGVYRLRDWQKMVDTSKQTINHSESLRIDFSPDSSAVATLDGIYRLSDGEFILPTTNYFADFSPDGAYAVSREGVIRLSDGEKILGSINYISFTPNGEYAVLPGSGVYRLSDGQRQFGLPAITPAFTPPMYSSDSQYMVIGSDGLYRLDDGEMLLNSGEAIFSPDSSLVAIGRDGVYRLDDMQKLFNLTSDIGSFSHFSNDGAFLATASEIIRVADGRKLFDKGAYSMFSPDSEYVAFHDDGLYRLSDQQKQFDIDGTVNSFTSEGNYLSVGYSQDEASVYRVRDGRQYNGLRFLNISSGIMAVGNNVLVVDPAQWNQ